MYDSEETRYGLKALGLEADGKTLIRVEGSAV